MEEGSEGWSQGRPSKRGTYDHNTFYTCVKLLGEKKLCMSLSANKTGLI